MPQETTLDTVLAEIRALRADLTVAGVLKAPPRRYERPTTIVTPPVGLPSIDVNSTRRKERTR
jgi:hypothetical protein